MDSTNWRIVLIGGMLLTLLLCTTSCQPTQESGLGKVDEGKVVNSHPIFDHGRKLDPRRKEIDMVPIPKEFQLILSQDSARMTWRNPQKEELLGSGKALYVKKTISPFDNNPFEEDLFYSSRKILWPDPNGMEDHTWMQEELRIRYLFSKSLHEVDLTTSSNPNDPYASSTKALSKSQADSVLTSWKLKAEDH